MKQVGGDKSNGYLDEVRREASQRRGQRPENDGPPQDPPPVDVLLVAQHAENGGENHVNHDHARGGQRALKIIEGEVRLNQTFHCRRDVAIRVIQEVDERQRQERDTRATLPTSGFCHCSGADSLGCFRGLGDVFFPCF
jgi:hypothetical protein